MKKIEKKITAYTVKTESNCVEESQSPQLETISTITRDDVLKGETYKIKSPQLDRALYITINDVMLNQGTEYETRQPYEIFINSANNEHFQWVLALTRTISASLRHGVSPQDLATELKSVFGPNGGYFKKGGKFMPSLVAEIGYTLENHIKQLGMIKPVEMDVTQREFLEAKRKEFETKNTEFPASATMCGKCHTKAVVIMDGCATCLSCGDSKCG